MFLTSPGEFLWFMLVPQLSVTSSYILLWLCIYSTVIISIVFNSKGFSGNVHAAFIIMLPFVLGGLVCILVSHHKELSCNLKEGLQIWLSSYFKLPLPYTRLYLGKAMRTIISAIVHVGCGLVYPGYAHVLKECCIFYYYNILL